MVGGGGVLLCDYFLLHISDDGVTDQRSTRKQNRVPDDRPNTRLLVELVISRHGMPEKIISDRGTQFESALWMETVERLGSRVALATTHHPQTNGITERANRTLLQMIRRVCENKGAEWVKWLPLLEFAYNSSVHSSTRISPFYVNYGYSPRVPASFLSAPVSSGNSLTQTEAVTAFCRQLQEQGKRIWEQVKQHSEAVGRQIEERENKKRGQVRYQPGDEVLCYQSQLKRGEGEEVRKQQLRYIGPFVVKEVSPKGWVELLGLPRHVPTKYNCEFLKPYRRCLAAENWRTVAPPPAAIMEEGKASWEVEAILAERQRRKGKEFLIKWKGYNRPTWEPRSNLDNCPEVLSAFRSRLNTRRQK